MAKKVGRGGATVEIIHPCECGSEMKLFFKMITKPNNPFAFRKKPKLYWRCTKCNIEEKHIKRKR
jgi:hypothetical protein